MNKFDKFLNRFFKVADILEEPLLIEPKGSMKEIDFQPEKSMSLVGKRLLYEDRGEVGDFTETKDGKTESYHHAHNMCKTRLHIGLSHSEPYKHFSFCPKCLVVID